MAKVLMKGNEAIAEAAVIAGCRLFFGYPITPQNQIPEYMARRLPQVGGVFLQAESELAAINMVYGAAATGRRVMTSSSSPGISLKQEGISYLAAAELPAVIVNIMRGGPGLGSIQASQGDYFQATKNGHGDYHLIVLAPASVQEAAELTQLAFDLSDQYRVPAMILGDGMIGQMMEPVDLKEIPKRKLSEKGWAASGMIHHPGKRNVVNSLYIEPEEMTILSERLAQRYKLVQENEVRVHTENLEGAKYILTAYGTVARICKTAITLLKEKGITVGLIRPISLWPFPHEIYANVADDVGVKAFIDVEMSLGQMVEDVRLGVNGKKPVHFVGKSGVVPPTAREIADKILELEGRA